MYSDEESPAWPTYGLDQTIVEAWVRKTFGDKVMDSPLERGLRVVEEAIEVLQTQCGDQTKGRDLAHRLVDEVFDKPIGKLPQEVGGLGVTILALCALHDMRFDTVVRIEIDRVQGADRDKIRAKQRAKADKGLALRPD